MKKSIKLFFIAAIAMGALVISISIASRTYAKNLPKFSYQEYEVYDGDTLWSIAVQCDIEQDIRETIYNIRKTNHLDTALIYPGQKLLVPVKD